MFLLAACKAQGHANYSFSLLGTRAATLGWLPKALKE